MRRLNNLTALLLSLGLAITTQAFAANPISNSCDPTLLTEARPISLRNVVVVAGYSSGADIAPELVKNGFKNIIHVHPENEIPGPFAGSFHRTKASYSQDLTYGGNVEALVSELTAGGRKIDAVFAGTETGVPLANLLNQRLGLKGNNPAMSEYHRVKSLMQERIDAHGLSSILGLKTHDIDQALSWIATKNKGLYPVVVKPIDGAGTQGFHLCYTEAEVRAAFAKLLGGKTLLNGAINDVLVQRYINAEEYVVNTVSRDGKHVVTEIWHYNKRTIKRPEGGNTKIYDFDELLPLDSPEAKQLLPYAFKVLDALEISQGPAHMELMLPSDGPVLMEVGTRLMGGSTYGATREALGTSALDLMIDGALFPEKFEKAADTPITIKKHVRQIQFISKQKGTITRVNYTKEQIAAELPSFAAMSSYGVGAKLTPTVDLITSPGSMWLIADSPAQLERDYQKFRNEIEPRLFDVAP